MQESKQLLRFGTRTSRLALVQTRDAIRRLASLLPGLRFEEVGVSTPGDRDLSLDLRESPQDFFTRDLDEKLLAGEIDLAVHSAKDLPDPLPDDVDWFWLPWREDPRDVLIRPPGLGLDSLPANARIGVSSERREEYCRRRFPDARQLPIRGNIEERLRQLDEGQYDLVVMAGAALNRLGLRDRATEWIPVADLAAPDEQGYLALTFRAGDEKMLRIRSLFVKAVTFAAGGVGSGGTCTQDVVKALQRCDVCLHDALMGQDLLEHVPAHALRVHVGKRCGRHSLPQPEITQLICTHARRGARVVRLKGGDPGIFGRLAEEVEALERLGLPYRALPGVTSLTAATTGTGMLLTRRGHSRGFCTMTPRKEGGGLESVGKEARAQLPIVFYMAVSSTKAISEELLAEGMAPDTPAAVVFGAGSDQAYTVKGTIGDLAGKIAETEHELPGTLLVGDVAGYAYRTALGALQGQRVLLTCSESLQEKAAGPVHDFGGVPVCRPLIRLVASRDCLEAVRRIDAYEWVVLTSPSAVRCLGQLLREAHVDLRRVPSLVTCGGGTSRELAGLGLRADLEPGSDFGADGLIHEALPRITPGMRILRLRSDKAGPSLAAALREAGAEVDDCVLYQNEPIEYDAAPEFDSVFFASASAVEVFASQWGPGCLDGKTVLAIGKPTVAALKERGVTVDLVGAEATVESSIETLATHAVGRCLAELP